MKSSYLVFLLCLSGAAAHADEQREFSFRAIVPATTQDCASLADRTAASFAQAAPHVSTATGSCQGTRTLTDTTDGNKAYTLDVIAVDYFAPAEVTLVQAIFGGSVFDGTASEGFALFKTYADCLDAIPAQEKLFSEQEGLAPLVSYCTASSDESIDPGYSLTIEGAGTAKNRLYAFALDSSTQGVPHVTIDDKIVQDATEAAKLQGATVAFTDLMHLFYYAPYDLSITSQLEAIFSESSQCQAQVNEIRDIYIKGGAIGSGAECEGGALMVVGSELLKIDEDFGMNSTGYETFDECMQDSSRVFQNALNTPSEKALGVLCKPSDDSSNGFVADVFTASED